MISFLSILAVGFFLGMRHATDPDHVIAVTTIVSNQRNARDLARCFAGRTLSNA
jgi:high-affinity nickel-transport protein